MYSFLQPKNILFIPSYQFEGRESADKLLIVLGVNAITQESLIYQVLTTSRPIIPNTIALEHGCIESVAYAQSFFLFKQNVVIGQKEDGTDFSFDKNTFLLAEAISQQKNADYDKYESSIKFLGVLDELPFRELLTCFANSHKLKRKFKPYFEQLIRAY